MLFVNCNELFVVLNVEGLQLCWYSVFGQPGHRSPIELLKLKLVQKLDRITSAGTAVEQRTDRSGFIRQPA